ncbi:symmetrical bis(5'-nucleosyl)-tetraphosphatase [Rivibacter subsaxonicus]|uniref:bis(5'-nucleosyl)-tetraphosphatase (symmetrical) n=1 Tax=Rivibacter subsaxonicus TaxID=457575 RepID=A0A4Q7VZX8_9BURK|nr:symmetrical bis(5'-nucleosyl)-tetraphosphatase [Rivibacter subsaxonicus]RZU02492.1 bis(5'nucleosyl)-tetraphosphatase ApaH [Rivibacter subsaxonicus]
MIHLIGDLQGCCDALDRLLAEIGFSASRDRIFVLGDLVNRGPASLRTLERLASFGDAASCLLGNHDLHLLAVAQGVRKAHRSDTFDEVLASPRRAHWLDWLRHRQMAAEAEGWLLVHAGVAPQWDRALTLQLAAELEACLRGPDLHGFLEVMYGNEPSRWSDALAGHERLRFAVNVLTRIRFCTAEGMLDLKTKEGADGAPPGLMPWFAVPGRRTEGDPIAFGHWSTLGLIDRPDLLALDTGCVWGGALSAVRVDGGRREVLQVKCAQAQRPG